MVENDILCAKKKGKELFFWNLKVKVICKTRLLLIFMEIDILLKRMRTNMYISNNLYPQFWSEDFFNIEYEDIQIFRSIRSSEITWNKL